MAKKAILPELCESLALSSSHSPPGDSTPPKPAPPKPVFFSAIVALLAAALGSLLLVLQHLMDLSLPGCGIESACHRAAASVWGKLPIVDWPLSHVGLAFFLALLTLWLRTQGRLNRVMRRLLFAAGLVSISLIAMMLIGGYFCIWCTTVHFAYLGFLGLLAHNGRTTTGSSRDIGCFASTFIAITVALALFETDYLAGAQSQHEADRAQSEQQIVAQGRDSVHDAFTGRYRVGPESAAIRIVIFIDYQCADCRQIEWQVQKILSSREDVSFSVKHFPLCDDCNESLRGRFTGHANACRAGQAAEAAGQLGGDSAFFAMHHWLFDRGGQFTDQDLAKIVAKLRLDIDEFRRVMDSNEVLKRVQADVDEANRLGLLSTPMVFVNGIEMKGIRAEDALIKTVDWLASANPPPLRSDVDRPPTALEKCIADWRDSEPWNDPPRDQAAWTRGAKRPAVDVVIWGDYLDSDTATLDALVRNQLSTMRAARYSFRHLPQDTESGAENSLSWRAARAVEAGGRIGGEAGYWAMHIWVLQNQDQFDDACLRRQLDAFGIDAARFFAKMESNDVTDAIREDINAARNLGIPTLPLFYVNGRQVLRWDLVGENVPARILAAAAFEANSKSGAVN